MAGNQRETKLTLRVEALGQEDLKGLQDGLTRLAKEGGDAAPEFQRLADEVGRLGEQAGTLASFEKLAATTAELAAKQQSAEQASADLKARLDEQRASVAAAATAQESASKKYQEAKNELTDLGTRLKTLRAETDSAGKKTDEYKATVTALIGKQGELKKSLDDLRSARSAANQTLNEAEAKERKLEASYERSRTAIDKAATALQQSSAALDGARAATDALGLSTDDVAASQAQLIAALNRTGAEADALQASARNAANYIEFWSRSLDELDRNLQETSNAAKAAATQIDNAFGTVGIRGAQELEAEIAQVRSAMDVLKNQAGLTGGALAAAMSAGNTKIKELERELRAATGALTTADKAANLFKNSMGQIAAGNLIADAIGSMVEKVKELGREFIATTVQTEQFRRGLNAIYKDTAITAQQFEFLRSTANANGIAIGAISDSFVRFSAATKSANIPISVTNDLFASVTRTAGSLGLSAEATSGALDALGQIASKGVVSLEELRQQLGDRMPGALSAAAKGLGLTDAELIKLVESGNLAARDFFPAFSKGLQELQGETEGLIPTWNRLKNAFTVTAQNAGDSGWTTILTGGLKLVGAAAGALLLVLSALSEGLFSVGRMAILLFETLRGNGKEALEAFTEQSRLATERLEAQGRAFQAIINPADQAAASTEALTSATAAVTAAATAAGSQWDGMTRSQQASAIAAQIAADSQRTLGGQLAATNATISGLLDAQTKETEALGKISKAAKEQGDTLIALAKIKGNEKEVLDATTAAALVYAEAQAKVAASQTEETRLLELQLATLIRVREQEVANGTLKQEALDKETEALRKKIETSKAEQEQAKASADAARQDVEVRKLSAETYGDQSAKAKEYGDNVKFLTDTLARYVELQKVGRASDTDVSAVRKELALSTARYRDALNDSVQALRLESQEKSINLQASLSAKNTEVALYEAKAQSARNSGDLRMATYYETEAKRSKIEADRLSIQIKEVELTLEREELKLKLELLKATEPENALKQKEIELRLKLTDIKQREIEASKELLRIKDNDRIMSGSSATASTNEANARLRNANAVQTEASAIESSLSAREKEIALKEKEIELRDREAVVSRQGSASMSSDIATRTGILNFLKQAGVDDEAVAKRLANEFADNNGNVVYSNNPGQIKYGGKYGTLSEALLKAAETYTFREEALRPTTPASNTGALPSTPTPTPTTPTSGQVITINVKTPNGNKSVKVASQSDAAALESILREFETAAGTAA